MESGDFQSAFEKAFGSKDHELPKQQVENNINASIGYGGSYRPSCPNCGYCPHCGRSGWPYNSPWYRQYPYGYWAGNDNGIRMQLQNQQFRS